MGVRLALLLVALGATQSFVVAPSATADSCPEKDRLCSDLAVPLDRSGGVPGTVQLHVEHERAAKPTRAPLFLIAGGPGQSASRAFPDDASDLIGTEARLRDVIVMDLRGTGSSGVLRCAALERVRIRDQASAGAACAAQLGPRRGFYTANDSADDIESVRQRLGVPKIALLGVSYGTEVAMAYARRYPANVERIVLDSAVEVDGIDPLYGSGMRATPRILQGLCAKRRCRGITRDAVGDLARLAARLEAKPVRGRVFTGSGRPRPVMLDSFGLFTVLAAGDLNPLARSGVPGAVRNALRGDPAPLLRAYRTATATESRLDGRPRVLSAAAYAAALCEEARFPWAPGAPGAVRAGQAKAFVTALAPGAFGPFGSSAPLASDLLSLCREWPAPRRPSETSRMLPNVPMLVLAGGADLRTPVENARAIAAQNPSAQLMVVPNSGHSVIGNDFSGCVDRALRRFLAGGQGGRCRGESLGALSRALPVPPASLKGVEVVSGHSGRRGRTAAAVGWTVLDGLMSVSSELWTTLVADDPLRALRHPLRVGGLRGGSFVFDLRRQGSLRLRRASAVLGVRVSGRLVFAGRRGVPLSGLLRVSGNAASEGYLRVRGMRMAGRLGGRAIRVSLIPPPWRRAVGASGSISRSSVVRIARARSSSPALWRMARRPHRR